MKVKSIIISAVAAVAIVGGGTATALASTGAGHEPGVQVEHPTTGDAPDDGTIQLPPADVVEMHPTPLDATPIVEDQTGTGDDQITLEPVNPQ